MDSNKKCKRTVKSCEFLLNYAKITFKVRLKSFYFLIPTLAILFFVLVGYQPNSNTQDNFSEIAKIALRDAGNKLLLSNNDSTSLILPVLELEKNRYQLSFQNNLLIVPDNLIRIVTKSLEASHLPNNYIIEVVNCNTKEVSYSYQIKDNKENNIIPCMGRNLPLDCYSINVLFMNDTSSVTTYMNYSLFSLALIAFVSVGLFYKKRGKDGNKEKGSYYSVIGNYKFYKDQNKLVKGESIIKLTSKECELIKIFSENQNQIVKRELLIKEVWEDNGVFVGRSLDAFISKIRKKFEGDNSVNIINIHGVGYKLETSKNL